jgi:hypothetical protein
MEATVIECYIDIEDIAVDKDPFVWNTVTDNLVRGCAYGFRKVAVVQRRGI